MTHINSTFFNQCSYFTRYSLKGYFNQALTTNNISHLIVETQVLLSK